MSTFVITGAKSGIGLEMTRQLLASGHDVIAGVRKPADAHELRQLESTKLKILELDITSDQSVASFAKAIGTSPIDALINNAGIFLRGEEARFEQTSARTLLETFDTNCAGPLRVSTALLSLLKKSKNPKIANISSLLGSIDDNTSGGSTSYRVSKAALNMLSKIIAIEQPEITVLSLHPGWVKTRMGGDGAPLTVETSASGLLKVIGEATGKVTGHFINYDGRELRW